MRTRKAQRCLLAATLCLCVAVLSGCTATPAPQTAQRTTEPDRELMVVLRPMHPDLWPRTASMLAAAFGLRPLMAWEMKSISAYCVVYQLAPRHDEARLIERLQADSRVEMAQPRQDFHLLAAPGPEDPYAHLQNGAVAIHAAAAHRYADGRGVRVAIVDTGIDFTHPDLSGRVLSAINFVRDGESSFTRDRHGTAIAGIVAANAGNRQGIEGIAPRAQLLALKACRESSAAGQAQCDTYSLALAIDYAVTNGAQIINLSLAGPQDALLTRLIENAVKRGITVVAADDPGIGGVSFPASVAGVIAVAAKDTRPEARAVTSLPDGVVSAPGFEILTTLPEGRYDFMSGSSMAAAHASGVAALLLQLNPELQPARVETLMLGTEGPTARASQSLPVDREIDACAAVVRLRGAGSCGIGADAGSPDARTRL